MLHAFPNIPVIGPLLTHTILLPAGQMLADGIYRQAFYPAEAPENYIDTIKSLYLRPDNFTVCYNRSMEQEAVNPNISFSFLHKAFPWRPIPGCPGRYVLPGRCNPAFETDYFEESMCSEYHPEAAQDPVFVRRIKGGGVISYRKNDGRFVHTLNNTAGMERKLKKLNLIT